MLTREYTQPNNTQTASETQTDEWITYRVTSHERHAERRSEFMC